MGDYATFSIEKHSAPQGPVVGNRAELAGDGPLRVKVEGGGYGIPLPDAGIVLGQCEKATGCLTIIPMKGPDGFGFTFQMEVAEPCQRLFMLGAFGVSIENMKQIGQRILAEVELLEFEQKHSGG